jgi:hypothetical protein
MKLRSIVVVLTAASAVVVARPAVVAASPGAAVEVVSVNGSGCPAGTASAVADGSGFQVTYAGFVARTGAGATPVEFRRNCQVGVLIRASAGFAFTVAAAGYNGDAALPGSASALRSTNYYLQGSPANEVHSNVVPGPYVGAWSAADAPAVLGPCGADRILNVNTELRVSSSGTARVSLRDSSARIGWRPCP